MFGESFDLDKNSYFLYSSAVALYYLNSKIISQSENVM